MKEELNIQLEQLSIGFQNGNFPKLVFSNLNLVFNTGSFVGLIGNNGLGKSTLIKTICGIQKPLSGTIMYGNTNLLKQQKVEIAKQISVVLTERISGFNLTVFDFVSSGRTPYTNAMNQLKEHDYSVIEQVIQYCGLTGFESRKLDELSDGLYQKTAIAKAMAQEAPFILLDEPSAYLDFSSKHVLFNQLKQFTEKENKCIIASSHDLDLVLKYCTHLLILSENNRFDYISVIDCKSNALFNEVTKDFFSQS
jgi:iron complex transport system ATP-binding protein